MSKKEDKGGEGEEGTFPTENVFLTFFVHPLHTLRHSNMGPSRRWDFKHTHKESLGVKSNAAPMYGFSRHYSQALPAYECGVGWVKMTTTRRRPTLPPPRGGHWTDRDGVGRLEAVDERGAEHWVEKEGGRGETTKD